MVYTAAIKPMASRFDNRVEMANEFLICYLTWLSVNFSDLMMNQFDIYAIGWKYIFVFCLVLLLNIVVIILQTVIGLRKWFLFAVLKFKKGSIYSKIVQR